MIQLTPPTQPTSNPTDTDKPADFAAHFDSQRQQRTEQQQSLQADINIQSGYRRHTWGLLRTKIKQTVLPKLQDFNQNVLPTLRKKIFSALDSYQLRSPYYYCALRLSVRLRSIELYSTLILVFKKIWYYLIMLPIYMLYVVVRVTAQFIKAFWKPLTLAATFAAIAYLTVESGVFDPPPPPPDPAAPTTTPNSAGNP